MCKNFFFFFFFFWLKPCSFIDFSFFYFCLIWSKLMQEKTTKLTFSLYLALQVHLNQWTAKYIFSSICVNYISVGICCSLPLNIRAIRLLQGACFILRNANLLQTSKSKTASTNLNWLDFYWHNSIRIFSTLFICFALDDL